MDLMLDRRLQTAPIRTQTIGLDKLGEGFETILAGEAARILVSPNA